MKAWPHFNPSFAARPAVFRSRKNVVVTGHEDNSHAYQPIRDAFLQQ
jgi:hypothetical protein